MATGDRVDSSYLAPRRDKSHRTISCRSAEGTLFVCTKTLRSTSVNNCVRDGSTSAKPHNNLYIRHDRLPSAHGGFESPGFQGMQGHIVHRAKRTPDQMDTRDRTVAQYSQGHSHIPGPLIFACRPWIDWGLRFDG